MGIWRGQAAISNDGDWTHGAKIHLKFNQYRSTKTVTAKDTDKIGSAYSLAVKMLQKAKGGLRDGSNKAIVEMYFGASPSLDDIDSVLGLTLAGLLDTSEDNKIYLFTKTSRPDLGANTSGNVSSVDKAGVANLTSKWAEKKKQRPVVRMFRSSEGTSSIEQEKYEAYIGHIHLNLFHIRNREERMVALTIIHEATHRFAGTGDFAYKDQLKKWYALTDPQKLNNADSYANFCVDLY